MNAQLELALGRKARGPVAPEEVGRLVELLRGNGWVTAKGLALVEPAFDDRRVRKIAEASDGAVVSYPGSPGYCLFDEATEAEVSHAIEALKSQGESMVARSVRLSLRHHRRAMVLHPECNGPN